MHVQAVMPLAKTRRLGILEGAEQRLGLGGHRRVATAVGRVAARHALERRRAIERGGEPAAMGCRRVPGRAASRAPCPEAFHGSCALTLTAARGAQRRACDRLREIGPEVVDVLEADGQPQQALGHAALRLHARTALDQRLDAAEAGRAADEPHVVLAAPGRRARRRARRRAPRRRRRASGATRDRSPGGRGGRDSAPRAPPDARRAAARARLRSRPGAAAARAASAARAGAATRHPARARRRSCGASARCARAGRSRASRRRPRARRSAPRGTSWRSARRGLRRGRGALEERRRERAVAAQERTARVRGRGRLLDVGQREQRIRGRLDDRERGARRRPGGSRPRRARRSGARRRRSARGSPTANPARL